MAPNASFMYFSLHTDVPKYIHTWSPDLSPTNGVVFGQLQGFRKNCEIDKTAHFYAVYPSTPSSMSRPNFDVSIKVRALSEC